MRSVQNAQPTLSVTEMLSRFVAHFTRAIRQEMDSMRERRGSFEIALTGGERIESDGQQGGERYLYKVAFSDEKLMAGVECTLRTVAGEYLRDSAE